MRSMTFPRWQISHHEESRRVEEQDLAHFDRAPLGVGVARRKLDRLRPAREADEAVPANFFLRLRERPIGDHDLPTAGLDARRDRVAGERRRLDELPFAL